MNYSYKLETLLHLFLITHLHLAFSLLVSRLAFKMAAMTTIEVKNTENHGKMATNLTGFEH